MKPGIVACIYLRKERQADVCELKTSLIYIASSRPARPSVTLSLSKTQDTKYSTCFFLSLFLFFYRILFLPQMLLLQHDFVKHFAVTKKESRRSCKQWMANRREGNQTKRLFLGWDKVTEDTRFKTKIITDSFIEESKSYPDMAVVYACNPNTWEVRSTKSSPAISWIWGQPGLHKTLS